MALPVAAPSVMRPLRSMPSLAIPVGQAFNGTPIPLLGGVMVFSSLALILILQVGNRAQ